jgi:hypothetical protein
VIGGFGGAAGVIVAAGSIGATVDVSGAGFGAATGGVELLTGGIAVGFGGVAILVTGGRGVP